MTRLHALLTTLLLGLAAFGCETAPVEPASGMVVMYATVDTHRTTADTAALVAPLRREADDPHGYPYLIRAAAADFGAAPTRVTVRDLSIVLGDEDWTVGFDDLFAGDLEVRFRTPTGASHLVATIPPERVERAGAAIVVDDATFDSDALPEAERAAILAGDFDVTLAGPAGAAFPAHRASLELTMPVVFQVHP